MVPTIGLTYGASGRASSCRRRELLRGTTHDQGKSLTNEALAPLLLGMELVMAYVIALISFCSSRLANGTAQYVDDASRSLSRPERLVVERNP